VVPATPCSHLLSARLQLTLICDFRAVPSLWRPVWYPGLVPSRPWSGKHPSCGPSLALSCGPRGPLFSFVVRAAAANVNSRTRLSHMTPFSGRDWCTRERCRQNPRFSQNSRQMTLRILRRSREFPRIFGQSQTTLGARAHHPHPQPHTSAEAWCVLHRSFVRDTLKLVRDALKPSAPSTGACPGELIPGNESRIILLFFVALSLSPPESWSGANSMACQKAVEIVFPISQLASK
jgi:hypothetical protein